MTISELIAALEAVRAEHGDCVVLAEYYQRFYAAERLLLERRFDNGEIRGWDDEEALDGEEPSPGSPVQWCVRLST